MMNAQRLSVSWLFWLQWVLANIVGWAAGEAVGFFLPENTLLTGTLHMMVMGAAGGIAQWFILRRYLEPVGWWALTTSLAMGIGGAVGLAASYAAGMELLQPWAVLFLGLAIGIGQWLILRRHLSRAGWWVLVNTLGLPIGFVLALIIAFSLGFEWEQVGVAFALISLTFFGAVAGALYSAITGGVLVWLLRQPTPTHDVVDAPSKSGVLFG
jgi:hypothetical protein